MLDGVDPSNGPRRDRQHPEGSEERQQGRRRRRQGHLEIRRPCRRHRQDRQPTPPNLATGSTTPRCGSTASSPRSIRCSARTRPKAWSKEASETLKSFKQVADTLNSRLGEITDGLARFSDQGLSNVDALVHDSRRSINRIEEAVTDLSRNPQRIISGGDGTCASMTAGRGVDIGSRPAARQLQRGKSAFSADGGERIS